MKNMIKKYLACFKINPSKAFGLTYLLCICVALFMNITAGVVNFALASTVYETKQLTVDDFQLVGAEYVDSMIIINATNDTQMIYSGNIKKLAVKCSFSRDPGEYVCFYNSKNDGSFGTHKMKHAKIYGDWYIFEFPYGTKQIRMDTGVEPSITVDFDSIVLNSFTLTDILAFSTGELFSMVIIPPAVYFGLDTLIKLIEELKRKQK